ncbi:cytochrome P450 [Rhodocollybia butyracea]|uniref:Cytochrome P450 n=1 Tax=Rhodocollybia butyracea TaxID=206335 RepID=A0A9P5U552_9AGAR|nr:cytochrome P450 [Rhodocollybia butyracea]
MYILLASTCLLLLYIGAVGIYRIYFHPLHRYPGPVLAALTEGYEAYYNIVKGGGLVNQIEQLHKLYGPVIRIGPNTLHFNYRQAYHDIYTYGSTLVKDRAVYNTMVPHHETAFGFCDPLLAKARRNILAPLFSRRATAALEYTIQEKVDKLLTLLVEHYNSPSSAVDMSVAYRSLTLDIITSYCFAESTNALDIPNFSHPLLRGLEQSFRTLWYTRHFPWLMPLFHHGPQELMMWFLPTFRGYLDLKVAFERQVDSLIRDPGTLSSVDHETIYHHLLEPKDCKPPSRESLIHEAFSLISAGSDTVGNACHVGTFYALKYPEIHRRLVEELHQAWPNKDSPMSYVVLEKLPYLTAFIRESLRVAIGVVHPLPRVVGATTPEIGGLKLPPGTTVEMSVLFLHMNPDVFPDPHVFNPDRWLAENTNEMMLDFAPFCKGPRICLAWCELYLILGNFFRKLDTKLVITEDTIEDFCFSQGHMDHFFPQWRKQYRAYVEKLHG